MIRKSFSSPPRPGFVVGGAIRFGFGVTIGGFSFARGVWDLAVLTGVPTR